MFMRKMAKREVWDYESRLTEASASMRMVQHKGVYMSGLTR